MIWQAAIGSALGVEAYSADGVPDAAPTVSVYHDGDLVWTDTATLDSTEGEVTGARLADSIEVDGVGLAPAPTLIVGRHYWVATGVGGKGQVVRVTDSLGSDEYEISPRLRTALTSGYLAGVRMTATIPATATAVERLDCRVVWAWLCGGAPRSREDALHIVAAPFTLAIGEADILAVDPEYAEQAGNYEMTWRAQAAQACADVESYLLRHTTRLDQLGASMRVHARDCAVLRALYLRYATLPEIRAHYDIRYRERMRDLVQELIDSHVAGTDDLAEVYT